MLRETAIGEEVGEGSKAGKKIQLCSLPSSTSTPLQLLSLDGLVDELDAVGEILSVILGEQQEQGEQRGSGRAHSFPVHQA